jgi:hypothetical protein
MQWNRLHLRSEAALTKNQYLVNVWWFRIRIVLILKPRGSISRRSFWEQKINSHFSSWFLPRIDHWGGIELQLNQKAIPVILHGRLKRLNSIHWTFEASTFQQLQKFQSMRFTAVFPESLGWDWEMVTSPVKCGFVSSDTSRNLAKSPLCPLSFTGKYVEPKRRVYKGELWVIDGTGIKGLVCFGIFQISVDTRVPQWSFDGCWRCWFIVKLFSNRVFFVESIFDLDQIIIHFLKEGSTQKLSQ